MSLGIYAAAAGMAAQQQQLDSTANDLANLNTTGYKKQNLGFRDLVYSNGLGAGAAAIDGGRDFSNGAMQQVSDPLAVAINGPGFFQVKLPDGRTALTRDGDFQLNAKGQLGTSSGALLDPPITLPKNATADDVKIAADGTVSANGQALGKLKLVNVTALSGLQPIGDSNFLASAASGATSPAKGSTVQQNMLEASNVDVAGAMTDLIQDQRSYQLSARVITMQDQLMQIANSIRQ